MADNGPEQKENPFEKKEDLFTPTGELAGGYEVAQARANALAHAKQHYGEYVGRGKQRHVILWHVDSETWDEDKDCFCIVLSAAPEDAKVQRKGLWEYHADHQGAILAGYPVVLQSLRYTLPKAPRRGINWVAVTAIATVALAITGLVAWLYPPDRPPVATTPPSVQDDFGGPLLWREEVPAGDPRVLWPDNPSRPPGVGGQVAIENGEVSVSADYWWYDVWAVRDVPEVSGDFEASVRFRIMPDDNGDTTKAMFQLRGGGQMVTFGWEGVYKQWIATLLGSETRKTGPTLAKGTWVKTTIRRVGTTYQFEVNGSLVHEETRRDTMKVNYMALGSSVGTHGEGGTHVHFDDAILVVKK